MVAFMPMYWNITYDTWIYLNQLQFCCGTKMQPYTLASPYTKLLSGPGIKTWVMGVDNANIGILSTTYANAHEFQLLQTESGVITNYATQQIT